MFDIRFSGSRGTVRFVAPSKGTVPKRGLPVALSGGRDTVAGERSGKSDNVFWQKNFRDL
jgi:hypothetical protein